MRNSFKSSNFIKKQEQNMRLKDISKGCRAELNTELQYE